MKVFEGLFLVAEKCAEKCSEGEVSCEECPAYTGDVCIIDDFDGLIKSKKVFIKMI